MATQATVGSADLHYKMCKKIALLTKVIYHLNIKNEDHESEVASLKAHHEDTLTRVGNEAAEKVKALKELVQTNYSQEISRLKDELSKQIQRSQGELRKRDEDYKKSVDQLQISYSEKCHAMTASLVQAEKQFDEKMQEMKAAFEKLQSSAGSTSEELLALRAQLQDMTVSHEQKIAAAQAEHKAHEAELIQAAQATQRDLEHEIGRLSSELVTEKGKSQQFADSLAALQQDHAGALTTIHELEAQIAHAAEALQAKATEHNDALLKLEAAMQEIAALQSNVKRLESQLHSLTDSSNTTVDTLRVQLQEAQAECSSWKRQCGDSQQENAGLRREIQHLNDRIHELTSNSTDAMRQLQDSLSSLQIDHSRLKTEHETHKKTSSDTIVELQGVVQQLKAQNSNELETQKRRYEDEISKLQRELQESLSATTTDAANRVKEMEENFKTQLEGLRKRLLDEKAEAIRTAEESHSQKLQDLMADYHRQLLAKDVTLSSHQEEHRKYVETTEATIASLRQTLREAEARGGNASENLSLFQSQAKELAENLAATEKRCRELAQKLAKSEEGETALRSKLAETAEEAEVARVTARNEMDAAQARWKEQLHGVERDAEARMDALRAEKDAALAALRQQYEGKLSSLSQVAESERSKFSGSLQELQAMYDQTIADASAKMKRLEEALEAERLRHAQELKAALEDARKNAAKQLARDAEDHERQMADLRARHQSDLDTLGKQHREAMKAFEDRIRSSHVGELEKVRQQVDEKYAQQMKDLEAKYAMQLKQMQDTVAELRGSESKLAAQIAQLEGSVANLNGENATMQREWSQTKMQLAASQQQLTAVRDQHAQEVRTMKAQHELEMQRREMQCQRDMETLTVEAAATASKLQQIFDEAEGRYKEELDRLNASCLEWEEKYKARESRPEDVVRIKKLTQVVKSMDEELRKTQEEMKFFKLELINRETNFNKMFNRAPNVGVLQPAADSKGGTGAFQGRTGPGGIPATSKSLAGAAAVILSSGSTPTASGAPTGTAEFPDADTDDDRATPLSSDVTRANTRGSGTTTISRPASASADGKTTRERSAEPGMIPRHPSGNALRPT